MYSYRLPGGLNTKCYINADGQIKFDPPVYEQRYTTVLRILEDPCWGTKFKKIVDFGCGEMRLLPLLRRVGGVEHIVEVDVDEFLLVSNQSRCVPLVCDYLGMRDAPLRIEVFKGSIDTSVDCLRDVDAIIAIEVIEHLYPNVLENIPYNVFGFMQPKLAIFTTPNSEFNVLFEPLLENGFRHADHKFEWTRTQFKDWALNICKRFPNYSVAIIGVGNPPPDRKKVGYVTQIAIFARRDILGKKLIVPLDSNVPADKNPAVQYKEIFAIDFPFFQDVRTQNQKILDEIRYHINRCSRIDNYFNRELEVYQIPLKVLMVYVADLCCSDEQMRMILLENNYNVVGDFVVLPESEDYAEEDEDFDEPRDDDAEYDAELGATGISNNVNYDSEENWD